MKTKIALTVFFIAFSLSKAFSFNPEPVMESTWKGWGKQTTDLFQGGYAYLVYEIYNVDFDASTNTFLGKISTTIKIDGITYASVINIRGTYNPSDFTIDMDYINTYSEEALPGDLFWIYNDLELTLYSDQDHQSYYLLQGYTVDSGGYKGFEIEFSNRPGFLS